MESVGLQQAAGSAAQTAEQKLAAAHKALLANRELQFDFPTHVREPPPAWLESLGRLFASLAPVLKIVFWIGLAAGVVLIAWFVISEIAATRRGKRITVGQADWRPDPHKARVLLEDADRLAAENRFEEAIHLLLFRSIDELANRRPGAVQPALTSRDIARLDGVPDEPRHAFARIAEAVERTFFGGRPADAQDFQSSRRDYEAFAFSGAWR